MAGTNITTLAGLMETLVADTQAAFMVAPALIPALTAVEAQNSRTVQFPVVKNATRIAAASDATENTTITATAITIDAVTAELAAVATIANVSNLAMRGSSFDVSIAVGKILANRAANAINTSIGAIIEAFDENQVDALGGMTLTVLANAKAAIMADGYFGPVSAILHPDAYYGTYGLSNSLVATTVGTPVADELTRAGWVNNVLGVDIFLSSSLGSDDGTASYGGVFAQEAVGIGFHNPIVEVDGMKSVGTLGVDISGAAYYKVVELDDTGGCVRIASLLNV